MSQVQFLAHGMLGGILSGRMNGLAHNDASNPYVYVVNATCFPLDVMLEAIGVDHVDYFSLDIEGLEFAVLKSIPFDKVTFSVLSVEKNAEHKETDVDAFMDENGYRRASIGGGDSIYVAKTLSRKERRRQSETEE